MTRNHHSTPPQACTDPPGKRAFQRHCVDLHAFIRDSGGTRLPCVIRNFCMGGMFLSYRQPTNLAATAQGGFPVAGDIITIHCIVSAKNQNNRLEFQARVVRVFEGGAGVAFINSNLAALQVMQDFALQSGRAPIGQSAPGGQLKPGNEKTSTDRINIASNMKANAIMNECHLAIENALEGIIKSVGSKMPERMLEMSRDTKSHKQQNMYFNARDILKRSTETLAGSFRAAIHKRLGNIGAEQLSKKLKAAPDKNSQPTLELSLIEDEALTEWLSISDINYSVESQHKKSLVAIEQRLSMVFDVPIGKDNNPYGPGLFTESFLGAIKDLGLDPVANMVCLAVFKDVFIEKSCDLYQKLDTILLNSGVLPDLTHKVIRENTASRTVAQLPSPNTATNITANTGTAGRNLYQVAHEIRKLRDEIAHQVSPHRDGQVLRGTGSQQAGNPSASQGNALRQSMAEHCPDVHSV